jgi:hypothetical protein
MRNFFHISKLVIFCIFFLFVFFVFSQPALVLADNYGLDATADQATGVKSIADIPTGIGKIIGAVLSFIGIIFFILIIYAGFMWMTAGGDEQKVTKAKDLITQAVIGLIVVLAAYAITAFIGTELINTDTE